MNKFVLILPIAASLFVKIAIAHENIRLAPDSAAGATAVSNSSWFTHKEIDSDIWVINDNQQDNIYVVEGDKSALIIDTGLGYENLKSYVRTITDKPLIVVNSHAHPDHAGGNDVFEHVHIHIDELETLEHYTSENVMADVFERFVNTTIPEHLLDKNKKPAAIITIDEGFKFDLGNRVLDVIHVPGHTPGSIALHDKASKSMFTGDMANQHLWMQIKHATSLEDFLKSIRKLQSYGPSLKRLLPGHGEPTHPSRLDTLEAAAEKILSGRCAVMPYSSPMGEAISCHHEDVVIVYNQK